MTLEGCSANSVSDAVVVVVLSYFIVFFLILFVVAVVFCRIASFRNVFILYIYNAISFMPFLFIY